MARRPRRGGKRIARGQYRYTPRREAALHRAQMISARKRKGMSTRKKIGITAGVGTVAILGAAVARHKISGSGLDIKLSRHNRPHNTTGVERSVIRGQHVHDLGHHPTIVQGVSYTAGGVEVPWERTHQARAGVKGVLGVTIKYRHRQLGDNDMRTKLFGYRIPSGGKPPQAVADQIPFAHRNISRQWPHIAADKAVIQNEKIRAGTHYLSPFGVKKYPEEQAKRLAIDSRVVRWQAGLGWSDPGQPEQLWNEAMKVYEKKEKKRRRKRAKRNLRNG